MSGHSSSQKLIPRSRSCCSAASNMHWLDITLPSWMSCGVRFVTTVMSWPSWSRPSASWRPAWPAPTIRIFDKRSPHWSAGRRNGRFVPPLGEPEVVGDRAGRVPAARAADRASRMGRGAAQVHVLESRAVGRVLVERTEDAELVPRHLAVVPVAVAHARHHALDVDRARDVTRDDVAGLEAGGVAAPALEHELRVALALVLPVAVAELVRRDLLHEARFLSRGCERWLE